MAPSTMFGYGGFQGVYEGILQGIEMPTYRSYILR